MSMKERCKMGYNYTCLLNAFSAAFLIALHITDNNLPWYLTVILIINIIFLAVSSLLHDWKETKTDDKIKVLEKELDELRQKINE